MSASHNEHIQVGGGSDCCVAFDDGALTYLGEAEVHTE